MMVSLSVGFIIMSCVGGAEVVMEWRWRRMDMFGSDYIIKAGMSGVIVRQKSVLVSLIQSLSFD